MVKPTIALIVDEYFQPHLLTIKHNKETLILKDIELNNQTDQLNSLKSKLDKIEARVEAQEQYSRRTSLRFHYVPAPTDVKGDIIKPIDTDSLILVICHLKLNLDTRYIGRSHPLGETETHLDSSITDSDVYISGFEIPIRKDRHSHGDGIIMYYKSYVRIIRRHDLENFQLESDLNKNFMSDLPSNIREIIFINGLVNIIDKATHFDTLTGSKSLLDPILVTDSISVLDKDTIDCGFSKRRACN
ncbi:unnamed protein product [Mytilus coruscus]|uniref:Uncharacterized protein n=1 Tax=Mytilus coruscus TaxID=42192 RepID=A0A6J8AGN9_MYTCO|nr:unnamed protein product [Mytilus coruscus]